MHENEFHGFVEVVFQSRVILLLHIIKRYSVFTFILIFKEKESKMRKIV